VKIEYRNGDLFSTDIELILHGCNSKGVMGSGVAKIVREQFPGTYAAYQLWCSKGFRLGQYLAVPERGKVIINAVTQQEYGKVAVQTGPNPVRYVSYDAVAEIMHSLNKAYTGSTIAMPTIGAALGGGDWAVISAIIESELKTVQAVVYRL
jgi:O-acetyl-ADP-ribose deacetylase (regulator of RNase III)